MVIKAENPPLAITNASYKLTPLFLIIYWSHMAKQSSKNSSIFLQSAHEGYKFAKVRPLEVDVTDEDKGVLFCLYEEKGPEALDNYSKKTAPV